MKKRLEAVFIVHNSAWQLMNCLSAVSSYGLDKKRVQFHIYVSQDSNALNQIKNILNNESGLNYKLFEYDHKSLASKIKRYFFIMSSRIPSQRFFYAQSKVRWLKLILKLYPYDKAIFYDEGTHTLEVLEELTSGMLPRIDEIYTIFSCEQVLSRHKINYKKNDLNYLRAFKVTSSPKDEVWFIGQPLELYDITRVTQLELLEKFHKCCSRQHVIYIPHRSESQNFIDEVGVKGYEIRSVSRSIEYELLQCQNRPKKVVSFFSSALFSIKELLGDEVEVSFIQIPIDKVWEHRRYRTELFYKGLRAREISEVSLE